MLTYLASTAYLECHARNCSCLSSLSCPVLRKPTEHVEIHKLKMLIHFIPQLLCVSAESGNDNQLVVTVIN